MYGMSIAPWRDWLEKDEIVREKHKAGVKPQDKLRDKPHDDIKPYTLTN
jgi:hypothetical protein